MVIFSVVSPLTYGKLHAPYILNESRRLHVPTGNFLDLVRFAPKIPFQQSTNENLYSKQGAYYSQ